MTPEPPGASQGTTGGAMDATTPDGVDQLYLWRSTLGYARQLLSHDAYNSKTIAEVMDALPGLLDAQRGLGIEIENANEFARRWEHAKARIAELESQLSELNKYAAGLNRCWIEEQDGCRELESQLSESRSFGQSQMDGFNDINAQFQEQSDALDLALARLASLRESAEALQRYRPGQRGREIVMGERPEGKWFKASDVLELLSGPQQKDAT